jgi:hypothetical protein
MAMARNNNKRNYRKKDRDDKRRTPRDRSEVHEGKESFDKKVMSKPVPDSKCTQTLDRADRDNDPMWYFTDVRLAEQTSQLSFHSFLGEGTITTGINYKNPSIMVLRMNPSPGNCYYFEPGQGARHMSRNGLNLAATKLFTLLSTYSGRAANTYAPQDVATLILAMGEIVSCFEDLRRVFGVSYTFSPRNRALPRLLIESMGIDYNDFIQKRSIYIDTMNALITRFNQLPILGNIAYILKCRDIYQKIYTDSSDSTEAQLIFMSPNSTWLLDESTYSGGTILTTKPWNNTPNATVAMSSRLNTLDTMIEALFNSSTLNVIYADLMNLASKVNVDMFKLDYVTNDYVVVPEYNANFMLQVHNLDCVGIPKDITSLQYPGESFYVTPYNDVYPDPNTNSLLYNPGFRTEVVAGATGFGEYNCTICDMMSENYQTADVIEALRYKLVSNWTWEPAGQGRRYVFFTGIPDHYCVHIDMYSDSIADAFGLAFNRLPKATVDSTYAANLSKIDWAPFLYCITSDSVITIDNVIGDTNFWTDVPVTTLNAMNRIIYQCLFEFRV